jgi:hypothetical protein
MDPLKVEKPGGKVNDLVRSVACCVKKQELIQEIIQTWPDLKVAFRSILGLFTSVRRFVITQFIGYHYEFCIL